MLSLMAFFPHTSALRRLAGLAQICEFYCEIRQPAGPDSLSQAVHQLLIVVQVVPGQEHRTQDLFRFHQMVDVTPGVGPACWTDALGIDWAWIDRVPCIAHVELPEAREGCARATASRRHDAVEHIDAALNCAQDVLGPADAHEIARPVARQ